MQRILIAGATGYLGRCVVKEAKEQGYRVRALTRSEGKLEDMKDYIDEPFVGEVTNPETISGVCKDIDIVFSSIGITRQRDGLTYDDVDYQGNANLLDEAIASGVARFIYVSVCGIREVGDLHVVAAKKRFEDRLMRSGVPYTIVRPNAFFSDMSDFYDMAMKGRGYVFGSGGYRINPIDGEDLARVCVDAVQSPDSTIEVGGPDILTHEEILRIAFHVVGREYRVSRIPVWVARGLRSIVRFFTSVKTYGPIEFFLTVLTRDMVAPTYGTHRLETFFADRAERSAQR